MNKNYFITLLFALSAAVGFAQSANQFFADIDVKPNTNIGAPLTKASKYRTISVNILQLKSYLQNVPLEFTAQAESNVNLLQLPMPDGSLADFDVAESPMMEAGLAAQYPEIKTYSGHGISDRTAYLKISITAKGFHAMILSASGTYFIDPYNYSNTNYGIVYDKINFDANGRTFDCKVGGTSSTNTNFQSISQSVQNLAIGSPTVQFGDCQRRNFRLALAATGEYSAFHGGTVALALAAQVVTINRVNGVYEKEIGVHLNMVANNNLIIYTNSATDPFSNTNANTLLTQNQTTCDGIIGSANYDIGHVFSTGGGGLASTPCVCSSGFKAQAETGSSTPIGDAFDIDYVAHEMGHQFGGNHTFSANTGSCSGNANAGTSVEVGSGITIMAYAGICAPKDVANNSIDNFHSTSLGEITNFLLSGSASCRTLQTVTNSSPVITTSTGNKTIPKSTPFLLTCTTTDVDGDALTYNWEQFDNGSTTTQPPVAANTGGPMFRPFSPNTSPTWYFPRIDSLANNTPLKWEILPSVARTMNFKLTVRDNHAGNGCTSSATSLVTVDGASGPFIVTAPTATGLSYAGQSSQTITWNVANTTAAPVSCANVDIFLSTDGGLTYPTQLASAQPNDGVQVVTMPNVATTTARIMVRGNGNIFFDISNNNFTITAASVPDYSIAAATSAQTVCAGNNATYTITSQSILSYSQSISLSTAGLPSGASASFSPNPILPGGTSTLTISGLSAASASTFTIIGTSTAGTRTANAALTVLQSVGTTAVTTPAANATNVSTQPAFAWSAATGAITYDLQIATNTGFTAGLQTFNTITTNAYTLTTGLAPNTLYYWRVRGVNSCNNGTYSTVRSFTTANIFCYTFASTAVPMVINAATAQTISSQLPIPSSGIITDVNVVNLTGTHGYIQDLSFSLVSPTGTTVNLLTNICTNQQNFNINFDDASANLYSSIPCPPVGGLTYQPQTLLSAFNGQNINGIWQLNVADGFPQDGGTLDTWGLNVCYTPICNIVPTLTANIPNCPNINTASVVSNLTGGLAPFTYAWTNTAQTTSTITGLSNNTYAVTITDAQGCTASSSATIANLPAPAAVTTTSPTNAATVTSSTVNFIWSAATNSVTYQIDISTSNTFSTIAYTMNAISATNHSATLSGSGIYYWRVRGINSCGNGTYSTTKSFTLPNITCSTFMSTDVVNKTIGPNAGTTTTSNLSLAGTGTIVDLNVISLTGTHTYINDLIFSLKSPTNVVDTLLKQICGADADFKIGFDDASPNLYAAIPCPATDSLMHNAYGLLSVYNGLNANGLWQLSITDVGAGDGGILNTWGLNVCYLPTLNCTMTASTTKTNAACPTSTDGTATANTASGGAGPFTYLWSNGQSAQTATGLAPGTYTVAIANPQGCTATATATITSIATTPAQPGTFTTSTTTICSGGTYTYTVPAVSTATSYTWTYTGNGATFTSSTNTVSVTFNATPTAGALSVTANNSCGSSIARSITLIIGNNPIAPIVFANTNPICSGSSTSLGSNVSTVNWYFNGGTTSFSASSTPTVSNAGTYQATNTTICGTASSNIITLAITALPNAPTVSPNVSYCTGEIASALSASGTNLKWYTVASGGNASTSAPTPSTASAGATTYYVSQTLNGCEGPRSASAVIIKQTPVTPTISLVSGSANPFCFGGSVTLNSSSANGNVWSTSATTQNITVSTTSTITLTTTINGCTSAQASISISEKPEIVAQINGTLNTCSPSTDLTATANANYPGSVTYEWSFPDNTLHYSLIQTATQSGLYSLNVYANDNCPFAQNSATVNVGGATPTITTNGSTTLCNGSSVILTATSGNSYLWSNGLTTQSITVTAAGSYHVTVINTSCSATSSDVVITNGTAPVAAITSSVTELTCATTSINLVASGGVTYLWSNSNSTSNITATIAGTYSVVVTGANGCTASASTNITANNNVSNASITQASSELNCTTTSITLLASGGGSYLWDNGNTNSNRVVISAGTYTVVVTNANGCSSTASVTITSNTIAPDATISAQPNQVCLNNTVALSTANAGVGATYTWTGNGVTLVNSNITSTTPSATGAQTYNVTIVGSNGCSTIGSTTIIVSNVATWYQDIDGDGFGNASASQVVCAQPTGYVANSVDCNDNDASVNAVPNQPIITAQNATSFCAGNSVVLVSSAQSGNLWSNNAQTQNVTVTSSGVYSVTVANSCGSATSNAITVTALTLPTPVISQSVNNLLVDSAVYTTYQWSLNNTALANAANSSYTPTSNGNYTLQVTDANGCSATSNILNVIMVSVNDINSELDNIQVFPNPFSSTFTIKLPTTKTDLVNMVFTDVIGQVLINERISTNTSHIINLGYVATGVYFVSIIDNAGNRHIIKLMKN